MNLVSLIIRFLTPNTSGRLAPARAFDRAARRSMLIVSSAVCLGLALALAFPASSLAQRKTLASCEKDWEANKVFNQAAGITKRDWVAKCRLHGVEKPAGNVAAAPVSVPLKNFQVNAVCGGMYRCEKACGRG